MSRKRNAQREMQRKGKQVALVKVWDAPDGWKLEEGLEGGTAGIFGPDIHPLAVAVRVEMGLQTRAKGSVPASKLIWVSPSREDRPVRTLKTVVLPN